MSHVRLRSRLSLSVKVKLGALKILAKELVNGMKELLVQDLPRPIVEPHPTRLISAYDSRVHGVLWGRNYRSSLLTTIKVFT